MSLVLSGLAFVVAETLAAAAWTTPPYSYAHDVISDLGNPQCGPVGERVVCSPLSGLFNGTGLIAHGLLLGLAVVLLAAAGRTGRAVSAVGLATALGDVVVGLVPSSPATAENGTLWLHYAGATLAILGGNVLAVLIGRTDPTLPTGTRRASVALGVLGIAGAGVWLATSGHVPPGVPERVAVYAHVLWELLLGATLTAPALATTTSPTATSWSGVRSWPRTR